MDPDPDNADAYMQIEEAVSPKEESIKEADYAQSDDLTIDNLELPKSIVLRLAKSALPDGTLIQKDAKQVLTRVATYFVSYLGATIIEKAAAVAPNSSKTKPDKKAPLKITITPDSVLSALRDIDFDNFVKPLNSLIMERRKKN
ncbi:hypothetical protein MDAP_000028 [Mitosporidium daphniae]